MEVPSDKNKSRAKPQFAVADVLPLVRDLFAPKPLIYWCDFLFSITLAWGTFWLSLRSWDNPALLFVLYLVCSCAFLRSILFIHELAHRKPGTFTLFRFVWNLLCGMPMMIPSYTYTRVHDDHHIQKLYGRDVDGEYLPFGAQAPHHIIIYLLTVLILPFAFPLRYMILTPISYLHPKLRQFIWERASSLTIDFRYVRSKPTSRDDSSWRLQELGAMTFGWTFLALMVYGFVPWRAAILWYFVVFLGFVLNTLRTLGAHAYRNPGNIPMDLSDQFLDSVDIPGNPITTPLWAPVGLRYHATHHLFPTMPYHSLGTAYQRIKDKLPNNEVFLQSTRKSLYDAIRRLWSDAKRSQKAN